MKSIILFFLTSIFFFNLEAQVICNHCAISNPINTGLIACYPFSGNAQDQSGNNNHGTNYGASLTTDRFGYPNSAYYFNGSSYILVPNSTSLSSPTSSCTIAFWANTSSWSVWSGINYGSIMSKSNSATTCQYRVSLIGTGISGIINNKIWDYFIGSNSLNQWDFFVVVMNNNSLSYYKNGALIGISSSPSTFASSTNNPLYIGRDDPGFTDYYTGKIDDLRIYNRVLTYAEIVSLYNYQSRIDANAGLDKNICLGDSVQLTATGGPKFLWNNASFLSNDTISNPFARTQITRDYILTATDGLCLDRDTVRVNVAPKPNVVATNNSTICSGDSIQLNVIGANNYVWNNGVFLNNNTISNPIAKPATNTSFIVTGTTGLCSNKDTVIISVIPKPNVVATNSTSICFGDSIQLLATGASNFTWTNGLYLNSDTIFNPIAKPIGNTSFIVTGTNGICSNKDTVNLILSPKPNLSITGITSICEGDSIQLTASGASRYVWNNKIYLNNDTIFNPIAKPVSNASFIVNGFIGLCSSFDTISITVTPKPIISAAASSTICLGDSIQLFATGGNRYVWNNSSYLNNDTIYNPFAKPVTSTSFILKGFVGSCSNFDTVLVNVNNLISDAGSNKTICVGDSVQLNASGGLLYEWVKNSSLSDTSIFNPIAKPLTNSKYYVMVSDNICKRKLDSVEISISSSLITNAGIDTSICKNDSIQLNGIGGNIFTWLPNTGLSQNNIPNPKASPQITTQYILKSSSGNCKSEDTITITVKDAPTLNLGIDTVICKGETYFVNSISNADKFTWSPIQFLSSNSVKNPIVKPDSSITYFVKAEFISNNCPSFDTLMVKVNNPKADFTSSAITGNAPLLINFTNKSIPLNLQSYWSFGSEGNSNSTNPNITFNSPGKYIVKLIVTDLNGCIDSTFQEIVINDKLNLILPNVFTPNNDNINDQFNIVVSDWSQIKNIEATIWNRWGGVIYNYANPNDNGWDGTYKGTDCPEGVYFYIFRVQTNSNQSFEYNGTVSLLR